MVCVTLYLEICTITGNVDICSIVWVFLSVQAFFIFFLFDCLILNSPLFPPSFVLYIQPSHGDKTSNPEVLKWMNDLAKGRKQLKGT